jgi:hypothetical protein
LWCCRADKRRKFNASKEQDATHAKGTPLLRCGCGAPGPACSKDPEARTLDEPASCLFWHGGLARDFHDCGHLVSYTCDRGGSAKDSCDHGGSASALCDRGEPARESRMLGGSASDLRNRTGLEEGSCDCGSLA